MTGIPFWTPFRSCTITKKNHLRLRLIKSSRFLKNDILILWNLWLTLIFRAVCGDHFPPTFLCLSRMCSRLGSPRKWFFFCTYVAQTNWTIILGVERPCLVDILFFFLPSPNDVVKVNGATSLEGFRTYWRSVTATPFSATGSTAMSRSK